MKTIDFDKPVNKSATGNELCHQDYKNMKLLGREWQLKHLALVLRRNPNALSNSISKSGWPCKLATEKIILSLVLEVHPNFYLKGYLDLNQITDSGETLKDFRESCFFATRPFSDYFAVSSSYILKEEKAEQTSPAYWHLFRLYTCTHPTLTLFDRETDAPTVVLPTLKMPLPWPTYPKEKLVTNFGV